MLHHQYHIAKQFDKKLTVAHRVNVVVGIVININDDGRMCAVSTKFARLTKLFKHFIALVQNKMLHIFRIKNLVIRVIHCTIIHTSQPRWYGMGYCIMAAINCILYHFN